MRFFLILLFLSFLSVKAQEIQPPLNSNYLIENGISPEVLDAALSTTLQSGSFTSKITGKKITQGDTLSSSFKFIYDPNINNGIDIQIAVKRDSLTKKEEKNLLKVMQNAHSFSRMSRSELYDPSSLEVVSKSGNVLELSYSYDKKRLEPELKYGKYFKGLIRIEDGILKWVKITNFDRIKFEGITIEKDNFERTLYYTKDATYGGYYVSSWNESYSFIRKKEHIKVEFNSYTSDYRTPSGIPLAIDQRNLPFELEGEIDTLKGSLGWALPLMGKGAKKLGYKLPRPIGLNIFAHYQEQLLEFTALEVAINDEEPIELGGLFDLSRSTVDQNTLITMAKADVWLLPFLNVMAFLGSGTNTINGNLFLDEDLRNFLIGIGIDPSEVPDRLPIDSELTSSMFGAGATLAGGIGNINLSVNYQFMVSKLEEVNTTKIAHVISPNLGYMTPFGVNIMVGAQGQFYDPGAVGFIELPNGDKLNYNVGFKPAVWNYLVGFYTPLSDHFELASQVGFGDRSSVTLVFGYRF